MGCAIYARKSTEDSGAAFQLAGCATRAGRRLHLQSTTHGLDRVGAAYDDGGYTGANLERPALRALLEDIESGQADAVVRLIGIFEERGVSLVSVTQQMNTTDSLGRLTLNILLVLCPI